MFWEKCSLRRKLIYFASSTGKLSGFLFKTDDLTVSTNSRPSLATLFYHWTTPFLNIPYLYAASVFLVPVERIGNGLFQAFFYDSFIHGHSVCLSIPGPRDVFNKHICFMKLLKHETLVKSKHVATKLNLNLHKRNVFLSFVRHRSLISYRRNSVFIDLYKAFDSVGRFTH